MTDERSRGAIAVGLAMLVGTVPIALAVVQDWYVDVNAPLCLGGIGTQARPFCDIMDAVNAASDGDTIHIAPGTYFENVVLDKDLELIGTEGAILDGAASGSVVHVVDSTVTLTGLTLTNGSGTMWFPPYTSGGGVFAYGGAIDVTLTNCTVRNNFADAGGGVYLYGSVGSIAKLTLSRSTVSENGSAWVGGAYVTELDMTDSSIANNTALGGGTFGGVFGGVAAARAMLTNSTVTGNTATSTYVVGFPVIGGVWSPDMTLTNSTVVGNAASNGGGYAIGGIDAIGYSGRGGCSGDAVLTNSIIAGNTPSNATTCNATVGFSLVQGQLYPGPGNLDADPLFADPQNGDYRLMPGSPCIDAGNNLAVPPGIWTDLDGKRRFIDDPLTPDTGHPGHMWPIVDMGAHEFGIDPPRKVRRR